jgi:Polyketide cyclase / dehydrase and lipid transport
MPILAFALALAAASPPGVPNTNIHFHCTQRTTAPPARIWAIWTDVANWQTWDKGLKRAELGAPLAVGVRGRLVPDKGPESTFEITAVEAGRSYTFRTRVPLGALHVKRTLDQVDGHTQFTHEVWFSGISKGFFGWALGRKYRALLPGVLEAIKTQAEQ